MTIRDIGSRRELFVDNYLIERLDGVRLRLHEPRCEATALKFDKPWEGPFTCYVTVLTDGQRYRMYYRGWPELREAIRSNYDDAVNTYRLSWEITRQCPYSTAFNRSS